MKEILIQATEQGVRLDAFLAKAIPQLSRSRAQELIEKGLVTLEGKTTKPSLRLKGGERLRVIIPEELETLPLEPEPLPVDILYEDQDLVVVNKPPGMLVHPAGRIRRGTLVNALLYWCKGLQGIGGTLRPGIVHRLDKGTSGVMVVAKNDLAHQDLLSQFKERKVKKTYLALVHGPLDGEGEIALPIGYHPKYGLKRIPKGKKAKEAITYWRSLDLVGDFTLVEAKPLTGRTHQIRVHLSSIGHPLVGDKVYARKKWLKRTPEALRTLVETFGRPALHSWKLGFFHPKTGEWTEFTAPLPKDMEELLERIKAFFP